MSPSITLPFHSEQTTIMDCGGKGFNLSRLVVAGLSVPPGYILTTAAYDAHVEAKA